MQIAQYSLWKMNNFHSVIGHEMQPMSRCKWGHSLTHKNDQINDTEMYFKETVTV